MFLCCSAFFCRLGNRCLCFFASLPDAATGPGDGVLAAFAPGESSCSAAES